MEFDGELTRFDMFKNPIENHALSSANIENFVLQVPPEERKKKKLEQAVTTVQYCFSLALFDLLRT